MYDNVHSIVNDWFLTSLKNSRHPSENTCTRVIRSEEKADSSKLLTCLQTVFTSKKLLSHFFKIGRP
jgi:hypothetical protein